MPLGSSLDKNTSLFALLVKVLDVILYLSVGVIIFYLQFHNLHFTPRYQTAILFAVVLIIPLFSIFNVYKSLRGRSFVSQIQPVYLALFVLMLILAATAFITKSGEYYSRAWFLYWNVYAAVVFTVFRLVLRQILNIMRKHGLNQRRIVIIGSDRWAADVVKKIQNAIWTGFKIITIMDHNIRIHKKVADFEVEDLPEDIGAYLEKHKIEEVWLVLSLWKHGQIEELVHQLHGNIVTIRYFPNMTGMDLLHQSVAEILDFPVINIISSPMTGINLLIKALEDKVLSALILMVTSPLLLLIAILVKLTSPGPVCYKQERIGWNGKRFNMLKFRSMPVDAEQATGAVWATEGDTRPTKLGALLRRTSLDELPQFINVFKGEMSIVGPRPERPVFVEKFKHEIPTYMQKHLVKAGITGWAQVNGWRGNTSLEKRIEYDLYYINHWSLWFDLKIIFLTLFIGFVNKNAY
jgi:putative colanic acid biosysnthesis UDP-glucose lipid carrier transferase